MTKNIPIRFLFAALVLFLWQCRDKYVSPYPSPTTGYLVVEGYISGNGPSQFILSRTISLSGNSTIPAETNAQLLVEGTDNSTYSLTEQASGTYVIDTMALSPAVKYRIHIKTKAGKEYQSDFVTYKKTPAIDSVNFVNTPNGVTLYTNTHDPSGATRYYQWQYAETWEYESQEPSIYKYNRDSNQVYYRPPAEQVFTCWRNLNSTRIILGSSAKLAQDVIYEHLLDMVPPNSEQIKILFSIIVRQYALTEDGYNYLTLMQKNTESLGSIFDAQPSALKGNIHSLSDPNEQVVGFVSAGTMEEKRLFIYNYQVQPWYYSYGCGMKDTIAGLDPAAVAGFFGSGAYTPINQHYSLSGFPDGWITNFTSCIDCRAQGGTTDHPSFWPY